MTHTMFIELLAKERGCSKVEARRWVEATFGLIERVVLEDRQKVMIARFGTFRHRLWRGGRIPNGRVVRERTRLVMVASKRTRGIRDLLELPEPASAQP